MKPDDALSPQICCPHHACPPNWDFTPYRVGGRISIVFRFDCCDYRLQVNGLPVPGVHVPLPEHQSPQSLRTLGR